MIHRLSDFHPSRTLAHFAATLQHGRRAQRLGLPPGGGRVPGRARGGAGDVLGPVTDPQTVHQAKFSMGTVLAIAAIHGHAGLGEFDADYRAARAD